MARMMPRPASTSACPSTSRPASSRPRARPACPSTHGSSERPAPPWSPTTAATAPVGGPRAARGATAAGSADSPQFSKSRPPFSKHEGITMPVLETPEPISVAIDLVVGDAQITASERGDTVVEVRPSDESHDQDVQAAVQTRVEFADVRLLIKAPKQRALGLFGKPGSVDLTVSLPAGSRVRAEADVAAFRCLGPLGECRVRTSSGDIELDSTGALDLSTGAGAVVVDRVLGNAEISTGSGRVRLGEVDGTATVKNANGDSWIGAVTGDLRVSAANGDISVNHPGAGVTVNTANGNVRITELVRGAASLKTGCGEVEVGIRAGTAARLDVRTFFGTVQNHMQAADGPGASDETVEVHARSGYGDIVVRRFNPKEER